jgi:hypothetical protein
MFVLSITSAFQPFFLSFSIRIVRYPLSVCFCFFVGSLELSFSHFHVYLSTSCHTSESSTIWLLICREEHGKKHTCFYGLDWNGVIVGRV